MIEQRSPEWYAERLGHATASRAADIMAKTKTGYGATRQDYLYELAIERITGKHTEGFLSADMRCGMDLECVAKRLFEVHTGIVIADVGFIKHPALAWCGASPDGMAGARGVEIKCYRPKGHGHALLNGMSSKHNAQVQFQMWVCGFDAVWFVSYCEDFPPELQLFYEIVERNEEKIAEIEKETKKFLSEVAEATGRLQEVMLIRQERMAA